MGIHHLYSFITKNVNRGFIPVNMRDSVDVYKRKNPDETPTIVINLMSLLDHIFVNKQETLLGGRFDIYNERARDMFSKLKSLEVNLVFFINGPIWEENILAWSKRRNLGYHKGVKILFALDNGLDIGGEDSLSKIEVERLITFFDNFTEIAKTYGEVHASIFNHLHQDIVVLATERNVFAVIADDSDFLIFKGNWLFWSAKHLNTNDLITMEYNKPALRSTLSLTEEQMPLFASLSGNDILAYKDFQEFHNKILKKYDCGKNTFKAIAKFVQSLNSLPPQLKPSNMRTMKKLIFKENNIGVAIRMQELKCSIEFYCLANITKYQFNNDSLMKFIHDPQSFNNLIFIILTNTKYIFNFIYQDLCKNIFTRHFNIIQPILCRMMGVLLQNADKKSDNKRIFYFKLHNWRFYQPVNLYPEYPPCEVPPVLELLSCPYGENTALDEIRWNLLSFIISKKLNGSALRKIPKENLGNALSLFYLVETKIITLDEADCILIACNKSLEEQNSLDKNAVRKINGRDARLAFFYGRFYIFIKDCIKAVGLYDYEALLRFDGLYFHYLRKNWENSNEKFKKNELKFIKNLRIYSKDFKLL